MAAQGAESPPEFCQWVKTPIHVELAGEVKEWTPARRAHI